jgi:hypothetical protein
MAKAEATVEELAGMITRGEPVTVRGRKRPMFNLDHPDTLELVKEVDEGEVQQRFQKLAFVVATNKLARLPSWVRGSEVSASDGNAGILKSVGVIDGAS